jgi:hypothetical protein
MPNGEDVFAAAIPILDEQPWVHAVSFPIKLIIFHREVSATSKLLAHSSLWPIGAP